MSYQTIILVGHLGKDPEMRYTPAGLPVTSFTLATNRQYAGQDGQGIKETAWFRVSAWGKTAENCSQYLHKGSLVLVEGRLTCDPETGGPRIYSRQDGAPAASFEVSASTVRFLTSGEAADGEGEAAVSPINAPSQPENPPF